MLRAAIYLDPFSQQSRNDYVVALRAPSRPAQLRAAARPRGGGRASPRSARLKSGDAAARPRSSSSP